MREGKDILMKKVKKTVSKKKKAATKKASPAQKAKKAKKSAAPRAVKKAGKPERKKQVSQKKTRIAKKVEKPVSPVVRGKGPAASKKKKEPPPKYSKHWFKKHKKEIDLSTWTETELVILRRRSTRVFQKKQVPENLVRRILEAGRFAPSAGNNMHWRFTVVRDPKMLAEMETDARNITARMGTYFDYWKRPYMKPLVKALQYRFPNDLHPIPHGVLKLISELSFKAFWDAPTLILLYKDVRGIGNPDLDLGICGQNMIIAAHSMGLGTCWVGLVKSLRLLPKWRKILDVQYPYSLEQALCIGYPVGEADGFVERDTHAIDWFDENGKRVVY